MGSVQRKIRNIVRKIMKEMMVMVVIMMMMIVIMINVLITSEKRISENEIQMIMIQNNVKQKGNTSNHPLPHLHPQVHHQTPLMTLLMMFNMENKQEEVLSQGKRSRCIER